VKKPLVYAFALVATAATALALPAQATREVTGKVTIAGSGFPLQDALIGLTGVGVGVRTNEQGVYRLRIPATGSHTLQVRAIGYKRQSKALGPTESTADFALERDVLQLEALTITGAATAIEKRNAPTATAVVDNTVLARVPAPSIESALQGKVTGAVFSMNNGAPGGGGQIQIRGASSLIGRIDPLFVVDGVVVSNTQRATRQSVATGQLNGGEENATNRLADINPNDIENIEILKAAAASAIYGSQATNGVIIITTKRGKAGAPKFNVTQRVGTYQLARSLGSRKFETLDEVLSTNPGPEGEAYARSVCTPNCPYFDHVKEFYSVNDPSYETVATFTGGTGNTRYFFSGLWRDERGIAPHTSAKRQTLRGNLDQQISSKISLAISSGMFKSYGERGISNNDNALSSPLYGLGYTPSIIDLQQKDANGKWILNPYPSGTKTGGSNPFQTFDYMQNDEDIYRIIAAARLTYNAWSNDKFNLNFTGDAGTDHYNGENYVYFPATIQFQQPGSQLGGTLPGVAIQGQGSETNTNYQGSAVLNSNLYSWVTATSSAGVQQSAQTFNSYSIIGRGLGPQQTNATGSGLQTVEQRRELAINQAYYAQQELLMFGDKLYLSGAIRSERSSVNGDPKQFYTFPRFSGSYRFIEPVKYVNEFKLRASRGESGNQPVFGQRYVTIANYGLIGGNAGFGQTATVGNPNIKPERLKETELGFDATLWNQRVSLEATYYKRDIVDLLVTPNIAPSNGVSTTTLNGGEMEVKGYEWGVTVIPVQTARFSWTSRTSWQQNTSKITSFPPGVLPFGVTGGGFGNDYGRLRFRPGFSVSTIYGNFKRPDGTVRADTALGDANPHYIMSFSNDLSWRSLNLGILADYRHGGQLSNMTQNLWDEGFTTWDYDEPSPDPNKPLGQYRYESWAGGQNTIVYLSDGSFLKVREINAAWTVPTNWYARFGRVNNMRVSLAVRNPFMITNYNGFDPEVNNGGNRVVRMVDLAPYPPTRSYFLSIDLGF
jgi:TonB-linked SusC/RagA family outer membrane protein